MSRVDTVYLIHHSHTDIGYTHDQPIVWDLHGRFIEEAVRLADKYAGSETDGAFRWTVENTGVLFAWLQNASPESVARFTRLEQAGRIEVTGMFANLTPLLDTDQLIESFRLVSRLRQEYGFSIAHAMNCDVNGEAWPLVDLLLDLGIEGFSMAINDHFGGAPLSRPAAFWWQGPSGRKILAYNGWAYDTGWRFGIGHSEETFAEFWPHVQQHLDAIDYPLPVLMLQSFHPFGDNGPPYEGFTAFIDRWNAASRQPRLVLATPAMWWQAVKPLAALLPTYRGDWTDFWNFGCISSARETTTNRASRARLRAADAVAAALLGPAAPLPAPDTARSLARYREQAWQALNLYDEHTWGADLSLRAPESEDTLSQWYHKAAYAYQARSLSLLLQRDALADLARLVARQGPDDLLLFNPLPWPRRISGEIPHHVANPRGLPEDAASARHSQDRLWSGDLWVGAAQTPAGTLPEARLGVVGVEVPGYGYAVVPHAGLVSLKAEAWREDPVVENRRHRLTFDTQRGGVVSWLDRQLGCEWVDPSAGYPMNGFVFEEVADHANPWPRWLLFHTQWQARQVDRRRGWKPAWRAQRTPPSAVLAHRVYDTPFGQRVVQVLQAPGTAGPLLQSVLLPEDGEFVEFASWWLMGQSVHPEATFTLFPFNLPQATARVDLGGQSIVCGEDQIPGVCYDYYTAQGWVDLSNPQRGVTVALPDNPMVQFGDFHFGKNQVGFQLERAMLLGWVTNTYWETNFRAHQPGQVQARYRVYPHGGDFEAARAYRQGMETAYSQPLLQHLGEPARATAFPASGQLLRLPETGNPAGDVLTLHVKPADRGAGVVLRLYNASDAAQPAQIGSGLLRITAAQLCDLAESPLQPLPVKEDAVIVDLPTRRVTTILLSVSKK
jgi:alpha-mannosidase